MNIDGLEWRRAKWASWAKRFLKFSERVAVRFADEVVTDNAAIQNYVMDEYGLESHLIEYGADHVKKVGILEQFAEKYPFLRENYAFKVCRIEPENNIHLVLEAFSRFGELPLVIVGNWTHSQYGIELRHMYRQYPNLHLLDPIYEPTELNCLRSNCTLYVHGHSAGGTNPSLVEAMRLELPILSYGIHYNRITTMERALYFDGAEDIISTLKDLPNIDLGHFAASMKWIADMRYNWSSIANKYSNAMQDTSQQPVPVFGLKRRLAN